MAYIYVIFELYRIVHDSYFLFFFLVLIGSLSIIYGAVLSLYEVSVRRLLGYGSIVHMGFVILGISTFELLGVSSAFFYILSYVLLILNFFLILLLFIDKKEDSDEVIFVDNITMFSVFLNNNFLLSVIFSSIVLSLAGLPFFIGFFSKLYILLSLISSGYLILVMFLLFINILATMYYIRLIRFLLFVEGRNMKVVLRPTGIKYPSILYNTIIFLFILNILILFFHNYVLLFILINIIVFF
jgi:NADH-quinone oxidoreductase subunit N